MDIYKGIQLGLEMGLMNKQEAVKLITILKHGKLICEICGEPIKKTSNKKYYFSIDHKVPKSKGGGWELENLQSAHRCCNNNKGNNE